ncbi:putative F-box domain-containing protein [Medicago truncatula]|uniref:Putative F-box domain-containing protein n=1 Tax=Medicago truncatula TaxID=3880 RepID=A0A396GJU1_MEDTR|nr:F-box/kelch-repeat protein At3g23880 [Medicago truncatula]RHN41260.1 putative F-box domain-containing protein [Medicago truncatula]
MNHHAYEEEAVQIADDETKPLLPIELVEEIFCRLPVKLLLQLQCMCKRWNSLISDPDFVKKHLRMAKASQNHHHLFMLQNNGFTCTHITSVFNTLSQSQTPLPLPHNLNTDDFSRCSGDCNGIICFTIRDSYPVLWNPSTRQYSVIPPVENSFPPPIRYSFDKFTPHTRRRMSVQANFYSFGYDNTTHKYKIVAISFIRKPPTPKTSIYTLGSDPTDCSWRAIHDFPKRCSNTLPKTGLFLSGTVNWLAGELFSLDLATETYQKLLLPTSRGKGSLTLGVLKDFLCIFDCNDRGTDIWMMMEFGNKESWHILYTIPSIAVQHSIANVLYISEDEQFLMQHDDTGQCQLGVYHSRNYTSNILELQHRAYTDPVVYMESLISPCSLAIVNYLLKMNS